VPRRGGGATLVRFFVDDREAQRLELGDQGPQALGVVEEGPVFADLFVAQVAGDGLGVDLGGPGPILRGAPVGRSCSGSPLALPVKELVRERPLGAIATLSSGRSIPTLALCRPVGKLPLIEDAVRLSA
jgi:hypothetical protein